MSDPVATSTQSTLDRQPSPPRRGPGAELLYAAVATGMLGLTRTRARVELIGMERLRYGRGVLLVATHRSEHDVPLVASAIYFQGAMWRHPRARLEYAAREDLFTPGFLAGFPPALPPLLRRALWRVSLARGLASVRARPLASATTLRVGELLEAVPADTRLAELLPPDALARLAAAADRAGRPVPERAGDALRGELADALWNTLPPAALAAPAAAPALAARRARATGDLRGLVALVARGAPLLVFPEGRPSADGAVGPLRRGLGALVRRGRPRALYPLAIAEDPLARGRGHVVLAVGAPLGPLDLTGAGVERAVLGALRAVMPLTAGQVLAVALRAAVGRGRDRLTLAELEEGLARAVGAARAEGRDVHGPLRTPGARRARLADALGALRDAGLLAPAGPGRVALEPAVVLADPGLARLAREHASVREPP